MATRKAVAPVVDISPVSVVTDILGDNMKVAISRSFKVNMGNYESADSFVSVTVDVPTSTDLAELSAKFVDVLDQLQGPDMNMYAQLTKNKDSIAKELGFE